MCKVQEVCGVWIEAGEGYDSVVFGCSGHVCQARVRVSVVDGDEIGDQGREVVVQVYRCNLERNMEEVDRWNRCLSTHRDQGWVVLQGAETGVKSEE